MPRKDETKSKKAPLETKRAGIYCRVSTRGQGESGISLQNQERRCRKYCESQDYVVVDTFIDVASAKDLKRPEMQKLRNAARSNEIDVIIALKLDRISRVPRDFYNLIEELNALNKGVVVVDDQWDTTTPVGRMLVGILIQFAAFEREIGAERTKAAARQRAISGLPGGGVPPLGYDRIEKEFHINDQEAPVVRRIFDEYLSGIGPLRVAQGLNEDGFRTKKHYSEDGSFRNGGKNFNEKHIHTYITNCIYCGKIHFNGEMFPAIHEPIVTIETWEDAQKIVRANRDKKNLGSSIRDQHVLAGLITCGICGDIISATGGTGKTGKVYHYYQCLSSRSPGKRKTCNCRPIRTEYLEMAVVAMIKELASTKDFLASIEKEFITTLAEEGLDKLKQDLQTTSNSIIDLESKIKNLVEILAKGTLDDSTPIEQELDSLIKLKRERSSYRDQIKQELLLKESPTPNTDALLSLYQEFSELWDNFTRAEQRNVLNLLIDGIEINYPKGSDKGEIILYLYHEPPVKSLHEITEGSHLFSVLLRRRDLNSRPGD